MRALLQLVCVFGIVLADLPDWEYKDWWKSAVVYQIYPRSFKDSNGDGIGDLKGIISEIDYIKSLGVNAVWLNPIYPSPNKDFGYDITDFVSIDPVYGTMDDFRNLTKSLLKEGIKIIMDFVPNHTSDEHPWFKEAVSGNPKYEDYYIWRDKYFNNWLSSVPVNGVYPRAWAKGRNTTSNQYYYHHFLKEQPDLNYNSKDVLNEMTNVLDFWLDENVYGFRMDAVYTIYEQRQGDNEPYICDDHTNYYCLDHIYTNDYEGTFTVLQHFRKFIDSYKSHDNFTRIMVTESYTTDPTKIKDYYNFKGSPVATFPFNFFLITQVNSESTAQDFANQIKNWYSIADTEGWSNWVLGNHDQIRVASRLRPEWVDGLNMLNLMLKGTAFTYYGEELGFRNTLVLPDDTQDSQGRDGQRTPMLWNTKKNGGFSTSNRPWLPANPIYWIDNVAKQQKSNSSHLAIYKSVVQLRKVYVLREGDCSVETYEKYPNLLALYRTAPDNPTVFMLFNMDGMIKEVNLLEVRKSLPSKLYPYAGSFNIDHNLMGKPMNSSKIVLPPSAAIVFITQPLDAPLKIDDTRMWIPKKK